MDMIMRTYGQRATGSGVAKVFETLHPVTDVTVEARMSLLYDYYGGLLGERRSQVFSLYHEDDLSLSEIAELTGITRQGVHDALKKAETQLITYEDKLGLVKRHEEWIAALRKIDPVTARMLEEEVDI